MHFHAEDFISITKKILFSISLWNIRVGWLLCGMKLPLTTNRIFVIMFYRWKNLPSCKYFCTHLIPGDLQKLSSVVWFGTPCWRDIYAATGRLLEQEIFYRKFYTLMSGVEIYNLFYNTVAKHEHVRRIEPSATVNIYTVHNYVYQKSSPQYKLLCTGKGQRQHS